MRKKEVAKKVIVIVVVILLVVALVFALILFQKEIAAKNFQAGVKVEHSIQKFKKCFEESGDVEALKEIEQLEDDLLEQGQTFQQLEETQQEIIKVIMEATERIKKENSQLKKDIE